jgi:iron complex outermembrane receptor protein
MLCCVEKQVKGHGTWRSIATLQRETMAIAIAAAIQHPLAVLAAEPETSLSSVVISATKIEQSTLEAPTNVSVITAEEIEKTNNQRLGDAMNAKVPGLYLRGAALGNARPGVTSLSTMRGQGGFLSKIAVLVDGMNMVDAYSGNINWAMVSMDEVERIEVVPGVGSSLYGSNAMGGVINIMTKEPTKQEISARAGIGFGDSGGKYASASYRNKFENGLGVAFGVERKDRDGYASEYVLKTPSGVPAPGAITVNGAIPTTTYTGSPTYIVGDKGDNASTERNVRAKLYFDLSPTSKIHAGFAYSDNKSLDGDPAYHSYLTNAATGNPVSITTTTTNLSLNGLGTNINERNFYGSIPMGNTTARFFAGYDGRVGEGKLSVNIGKIDRDSWSASAGAAATLASGAGTLNTSPNSTTNASVQYGWPIGNDHFIVAGLATEIGSLLQKKYSTSNWKDENSKTAELDRVDAKSTTRSVFAQDQISIGEKLTLYAGGRYDSWTAGGKGVVTTGTYPGTFNYADRTDAAFSPKLAGAYRINDGLSLKSSIGTGFRTPTNYYMFANPTFSGGTVGTGKMIYSNPDLKPEKSKAFDLGFEQAFASGGNFSATYYVTRTTDMIYSVDTKVAQYTDPVINKVIDYETRQQNAGSGLARGIELAGSYPVLSWLNVSGSYSLTDSTITSVADPTLNKLVGKRVIVVPRNMATLALEARQGDWSGVFSVRHVGKQYTRDDNSDVVKDVFTSYSVYTIAALKVGYQISKDLKLNIMVDNLFDREYYEYYRMPGRGVTLEIAGKF